MTQRYDKKDIYGQTLERLHDPYTARAGIAAETAGNAFFRVGDIFIPDLGRHLSS
jgi:hypothetical protein